MNKVTETNMDNAITAKALRHALVNPVNIDDAKSGIRASLDNTEKSFTAPTGLLTGLQGVNLIAPSMTFLPVLTPLRNMIPRVTGQGAAQANWKVFTAIDSSNVRGSLEDGKRGGIPSQVLTENLAAFKGIGFDNSATYESVFAGQNFQDPREFAIMAALYKTMIQEELSILGGNTSLALGATATPVAAPVATGGTVAAGTYDVICIALGNQSVQELIGLNNGSQGQVFNSLTAGVSNTVTRTNAGGTTTAFNAGNAAVSAASNTVTTTGATSSITASSAAILGAYGYAWYVGTPGNERLAAVSTLNSVVITSVPTTSQLASAIVGGAIDSSRNSLEYDGMLTLGARFGAGSPLVRQFATGVPGVGTALTSDGAAGIVEFDTMLYNFWALLRLSPTKIFVNALDLASIGRKIGNAGGSPLLRINNQDNTHTSLIGGAEVIGYWNKNTNRQIPFVIHPNLTQGTILFVTEELPNGYNLSGMGSPFRMAMRADYYTIDFPITQRRYDYGVYCDGVFQHFFPGSIGIMSNVGLS